MRGPSQFCFDPVSSPKWLRLLVSEVGNSTIFLYIYIIHEDLGKEGFIVSDNSRISTNSFIGTFTAFAIFIIYSVDWYSNEFLHLTFDRINMVLMT